MELTETHADGLSRTYSVRVPAADLQKELAAKIAEVQPRMRINGFRPGKVPNSHIRKVYGASMMQEIINAAVQRSAQSALEQAKARPAAEPKLDLKSNLEKVTAGEEDLALEFQLELMPEFEPVDFSTLSLERPVTAVSDAQLEEALQQVVAANRPFEDKDGPAEEGDAVTLDFVGKLDGEPFEGGSATDAVVTLGSKQFIPGFEEALAGKKAGDAFSFDVTFPEDYGAAHLAGKPATFEADVKVVKAPKTVEADDAFAATLGFDDLAGLKAALRSRLEADHAAQSRAKAKRALFDLLDAGHDFPLPPNMVAAEFASIWRQVEQDREAGRLDADDAGKTEDELRADYRKIAERRVRLGLLLAEIGRRNSIEIADQDVARAVAQQARNFPGQEQQVFELYMRNQNLLAQVRAPLFEEKVVDFILELAKVTDVTVEREALFAEDEPPKGSAS